MHEAGVIKQDAEQLINTLKGEIIPVNLLPASAVAEEPLAEESLGLSDDNQGFDDSNWQPQYLDLASSADFASSSTAQPIAGIGYARPAKSSVPPAPLPVSAQPPVPTNEQLARTVQPLPQPVVQPEPTILALENTTPAVPVPPAPIAASAVPSPSTPALLPTPPTTAAPLGLRPAASFNFPARPPLDLKTRLQALLHNKPATVTLAVLTMVMLVGGVFGASKLLQQSSSTPVASSQDDTTFQADTAGKLTLNLDTILAEGKTLTLGQLIAEPTTSVLQLTGDFTPAALWQLVAAVPLPITLV
ncbi:MAG: hypothetical protein AAB896_01400 [Patescibacteria group bacterium]